MHYEIITSQLKQGSVGGINTLCKLILAEFKNVKLNVKDCVGIASSLIKDRNTNYVVVGYSDKYVFAAIPLFLLKRKNVLYIPCFHPFYTMKRRVAARIYENTVFPLLLRARKVVALSDFEREYLKKIYSHVNCEVVNLPPALPIEADQFGIRERKVILFVGRDDKNKNLDEFLRVANLIVNASPYYEIVVVSKSSRVFPSQITHFNYLSDQDLIFLYKRTAALLVTSAWESLSLVGVEAVFCGAKVICNENVMLGTMAQSFPSLLNNNYKTLDDLLNFLKKDRCEAEFARFKQIFSRENFVSSFKKILSD